MVQKLYCMAWILRLMQEKLLQLWALMDQEKQASFAQSLALHPLKKEK